MYGPERQRLIVEEARHVGRVEVAVLAARFDVTSETVRRDLTALERQGLLRRVHGGAIPVERLGFEPGLDARAAAQTDQKERIAKAALAELPTEGAILIDAGTTTGRLAEMLLADRELTVITNSLPIAMSLSGRPAITLLMIGGRIRGARWPPSTPGRNRPSRTRSSTSHSSGRTGSRYGGDSRPPTRPRPPPSRQ